LKHGELTGRKPRLVSRADQLVRYDGAYDAAVFDRSVFDTEGVVWIELPHSQNGAEAVPADSIALAALTLPAMFKKNASN
jgi:hypothetical protein